MISSIIEITFPSQSSSRPGWMGGTDLVIELIALQVQIALLEISQKVLDSMADARREDARRAAKNRRLGDRRYALRKVERLAVDRKSTDTIVKHLKTEQYLRLEERKPFTPTEIALYTPV